jgi:formylmethanofuran:tetrahydromethanopterin formyltransferase
MSVYLDTPKTIEAAVHQRDLLGHALGELLIEAGIAANIGLSGPQLLLLAEDLTTALREGRARVVVVDRAGGGT